jgi:hypothetical protein
MQRFIVVTIICVAAAVAACRRDQSPKAAQEQRFEIAIEPLSLSTQGDSGQPQLTASAGGAILSWLERSETTATLKFSELASGAWTGARTVASSDDWFITDADVPTVLRMSDGTLVATTYPSVDPEVEAYDLRLSYSRDDGKTWSKSFSPHHDRTKAQHGFASLFEMPGQGLGMIWLDGRVHDSMSVYFASFDRAWKQTAEAAVNARVCECCPTAAAMTSDGPVVGFRDRTPDEIRDIQVARFASGKWSEPVTLHSDKWRIEACPVNGPALSANGRTVAAAWFTAATGDGHAFAAFSHDAGQTWSQPIRLDDQISLGRVDIELLADGSAAATWVEFADQRAQLSVRRVHSSGERSPAVVIAGAAERRLRGYPRLARAGKDLVFAWTESGDGPGPQQVKSALGKLKAHVID